MKDIIYTFVFLLVVAIIIGSIIGVHKILHSDSSTKKNNTSTYTLIIIFVILCILMLGVFLTFLGKKK